MKKCKELSQVLTAEYNDFAKAGRYPKLDVHFVEGNGESYKCNYAGGILRLDGGNSLAQAYGISQLTSAVQAKHLGDFLGEVKPRFPLRPLWLGSRAEVTISDKAGIYVPEFMLEEDALLLMPRVCKRIIELGYNSLMIGSFVGSFLPKKRDRRIDLKKIMTALHDHGLKLIVKLNLFIPEAGNRPARCPLNPDFREVVRKACQDLLHEVAGVDYVFWESASLLPDFRMYKKALEATEYELVRDEVKLLEEGLCSKTGLIFYLPSHDPSGASRQAAWINALMDEMGPKTILSFSSIAGSMFDDYREDHPIWKNLRESWDTSSTPLLPIVNIGSVKQGEGFWPVPAIDLIQRFYRRCLRHHFAGILGISGRLPKPGSILDCQLWTAGQSLWRDLPESLLVETWFSAFRPDIDYIQHRETLKKARETSVLISSIKGQTFERDRDQSASEECRLAMESSVASLKQLKLGYEKIKKKKFKSSERLCLGDHFIYFERDAKNTLLHCFQTYNIPAFNFLNGEDLGDSFWTQISEGGTDGLRGIAKVRFLDESQRGPSGSHMERVYLENASFV